MIAIRAGGGRGRPDRMLLVALAALTLTGCVAQTPTPASTPTTASVARRAATPTPVPTLSVPRRLPGELARTVVTAQLDSATSADFPRSTRRFYLHLRCTGPAGTAMRYQVLHADGSVFGPSGDWTCDRTPGVIGDGSDRSFTGGVQVRLQTDPMVTTAWAIVTTSAEGS